MIATFFVVGGLVELWTLWMGFTRPAGKAWPWFTAFVIDVAVVIIGGTWLVTQWGGS